MGKGAACLGIILFLAIPGRAQSSFESAMQLIEGGDFRGALEVAQSESDGLRRAQAELQVYHYAGDLDRALAAGRAGLALAPQDPWLLENSAYVALSLGLGRPAAAWLERLGTLAPGKAPEWMLQGAHELLAQRQAEIGALRFARAVALALLGSLLAGVLLGARRWG